ncbi:MAG TPA: hypothetical protein VL727_25635 [Puia sp.]|jgi:hypothetical protein|nr:hypothetical protein [Puia sp.]
MTSQTFLNLDLVLHITGFTMMAGTILADFAIGRRLDKYILSDRPKAITILETTAGLGRLIGIGAGLLILTGLGMVSIFKGGVTQMLWFKIKMVLVLLVILNGTLILQRGSKTLRTLLLSDDPRSNDRISTLKTRLTIFHSLELLLFLIIFVLSILRF